MELCNCTGTRIGFSIVTYSELEGNGPINFMFGIREGNLAFDVDVMFFTESGTASGTSHS